MRLADPAGDELGVLRAEVDDEDGVVDRRSMAHADALGPLQLLALGLQGRGDHHLGLLELLHASRSRTSPSPCAARRTGSCGRRSRGPGRAGSRAGVPADPGADPRAPRQRRVERGHAPVVARGPAPRRADDSGEPSITASAPQAIALAMSPPLAHPAVGDHVDVDAGLVEVPHAGARRRRRSPSPGARRCRARPGSCRRCPGRPRRARRPRRCA